MKYDLCYTLEATFDQPINDHMFAVMVMPQPTPFYTIDELTYTFPPSQHTQDGFGNRIDFGYIQKEHTQFLLTLTTTVTFESTYNFDDQWTEPFIHSTPLTSTHHDLSHFTSCVSPTSTPFEIASYYTHAIFSSLEYKTGVTTPYCTISKLLDHGAGVCQDFAHLMINLLRYHNIPSRYVVGFVPGEGESHAWVEAFIESQWLGFDPTHDLVITTQPYIKVAHGRDAHDCVMNKGVFRGSPFHTLKATVVMNERMDT
jgi:transglutaminase-like putative cysteine protease